MNTDEPDYSKYTLDELYDAQRHIDRNAFSERADRLDSEIALRKSNRRTSREDEVGSPSQDITNFGPGGRRFAAFVLDLTVLGIAWAAIDNFLFFPMPGPFTFLLSLVLFLLYFNIFETLGTKSASIGKRAAGLVVSAEGNMTLAQGFTRSVIVAAIVWLDWDELLLLEPLDKLPTVSIATVLGIQLGLCLYNLSLFLWIPPAGQMIQDRVTRTQVRGRKGDASPVLARGPSWLTGVALLLALLVGVGTTVGYTAGAIWVGGQNPAIFFKASIQDTRDMDRSMMATIAADTSIRTRVEVGTVRKWTVGESNHRRKLKVEVWIPAAKWNDANRERVMQSAVRTLKVEPGFYDEGELILRTGASFLSLIRTYSLEFQSHGAGA